MGDCTFTYDRPKDTRAYAPQPQISWFDANKIPRATHHRSLWLHVLNVTIESAYANPAADYPEIRHTNPDWVVWVRVHDKLFRYWQTARDGDVENTFPLDHRYLIWHVWARIHFAMHRRSERLKRAHTCTLLEARRLCAAGGSVLQYTVADLWSAVHMLTTAWSTLRYTEELYDYVSALAAQCGRYFFIALPGRTVFDHPSFVTRVSALEGFSVAGGTAAAAENYCVNEKFTVETERLFYRLLGELYEHKWLIARGAGARGQVRAAPRATSCAAIAAWIGRAAKIDALREFVAADFARGMYDRRALPGEVERFGEHDELKDATAYNAIAHMRPEIIDQMSEMVAERDLIEKLMARVGLWDDDAHRERLAGRAPAAAAADNNSSRARSTADLQREAETDIDSSDILITSAGYLLDEAFTDSSNRFATWFVCLHLPVPARKHAFPVIVRACHAWHVAHGDDVWLCDTAADAIECWVVALCTSPAALEAIRHTAPHTKRFFAAYRKITGARCAADLEARAAELAAANSGGAVMLPLAYADEAPGSPPGGDSEWGG